jgi:secondary thiamine-phosphate synthase enzyme
MSTVRDSIHLDTQGDSDIKDITPAVGRLVKACSLRDGTVTLFVPGSTAGLTTIEYEPGLVKDLPAALARIAPHTARYAHDDTWHDGNGHVHVQAALIGPSLTVPFADRLLLLGTWQQIVLVDFDNRPRKREVIVQIMGE